MNGRVVKGDSKESKSDIKKFGGDILPY